MSLESVVIIDIRLCIFCEFSKIRLFQRSIKTLMF